jgi:flagellar biosynthesis GTPase FlhF
MDGESNRGGNHPSWLVQRQKVGKEEETKRKKNRKKTKRKNRRKRKNKEREEKEEKKLEEKEEEEKKKGKKIKREKRRKKKAEEEEKEEEDKEEEEGKRRGKRRGKEVEEEKEKRKKGDEKGEKEEGISDLNCLWSQRPLHLASKERLDEVSQCLYVTDHAIYNLVAFMNFTTKEHQDKRYVQNCKDARKLSFSPPTDPVQNTLGPTSRTCHCSRNNYFLTCSASVVFKHSSKLAGACHLSTFCHDCSLSTDRRANMSQRLGTGISSCHFLVRHVTKADPPPSRLTCL